MTGYHTQGVRSPGSTLKPPEELVKSPVQWPVLGLAAVLAPVARRCRQDLGVGRVAVNESAGNSHLVNPAGADPGLSDVLLARLGLQRSGDLSIVADLMIPCHNRDHAPSVKLAADLSVQDFLVDWPSPQEEIDTLLFELPQPHPFVVFVGGVAGLADGYAQGVAVKRHLDNEGRTVTAGGLMESRSVLPSHTS